MNVHAAVTKRDARAMLVAIGLVLLSIGWFFGRSFFQRDTTAPATDDPAAVQSNALARLRYASPKEITERQQAGEKIVFLDIRSADAFRQEHIVDARFRGPDGWADFRPEAGTVAALVTAPDTPSSVLLAWDQALTRAKASFFFVEGGLEAWKASGGMSLSIGDPTSPIDHSKVSYVAPEAVERLAQEIPDLLVIDARSSLAYRSAHLFNAVNFPLDEIEKRRTEIPSGRSILVYGQTELEGFQAAVRLFDLHFFGARILEGGFERWKEKNYYVESSSSPAK